jgi:hypothetical protein
MQARLWSWVVAFSCAGDVRAGGDPFTIVVLPDVQHYTETDLGNAWFVAQTDWIVHNIAARHITFVTQVGDLVEHGAQGPSSNALEWSRADAAMDVLEFAPPAPPDGNVPYSAALGNHDYDYFSNKGQATQFLQWFGPARYAGKTWFVGSSPDGRNFAQVFATSNGPLLHITLEWHTADVGLAWAESVLAAHPDLPALVSTHEFIGIGDPAARTTGGSLVDNSGSNSAEQVFRKLVEPFPQICAVLCGHTNGNGQLVSGTPLGRDVVQLLADYQDDPNGGNGWLRVLEFDPAHGQLNVSTFSPTFVAGTTPGTNRALDPGDNFSLPLDLDLVREELRTHVTLHFRRGQNAGFGVYDSALDTHVGNGDAGVTLPGAAYGAMSNVRVDLDDDQEQGLLRFDAIVGSAPGEIPLGTTIERAILTLTTEGTNSESASGATLHRMKLGWNANSTWNSLGNGVQLGAEAETFSDADTAGAVAAKGTRSFDVTSSVQAWVDGAPDLGWLLLASGVDGWEFRSSDWKEIAERPLLTVRYFDPCPAPRRFCVGAPNSHSSGAWLTWSGATSLTHNDAMLTAHSVPPGAAGIFFYGAQRTQIPFGDGYVCIAAPVTRLGPPSDADAWGLLQRTLDFAAWPFDSGAGAIVAGSTWSFQAWYRDPTGPGGSSTNTSDALEVDFCPR